LVALSNLDQLAHPRCLQLRSVYWDEWMARR